MFRVDHAENRQARRWMKGATEHEEGIRTSMEVYTFCIYSFNLILYEHVP